MIDEKERQVLDYALAQLRMAYDMRQNTGSLDAREYERNARRALCEVLDVDFDLMRDEGNRA